MSRADIHIQIDSRRGLLDYHEALANAAWVNMLGEPVNRQPPMLLRPANYAKIAWQVARPELVSRRVDVWWVAHPRPFFAEAVTDSLRQQIRRLRAL